MNRVEQLARLAAVITEQHEQTEIVKLQLAEEQEKNRQLETELAVLREQQKEHTTKEKK